MASILNDLIEVYGIADTFPSCSRAFKQIQIQEILCIPPQKPDIEQIISVHVSTEIKYTKVIQNPRGISNEGQLLTGKKLIVEGYLLQKIEYVADDTTQSVHSAHFNIPFSTFIILGEHYNCDIDYDVVGYIEDIYIKQVDKRKLFKNVMLLLHSGTRI